MTLQEIRSGLIEEVSSLLYLDPGELGMDNPFSEMGLDSILGVELIKILNKNYDLDIKASRLYEYPTVRELSGYVDKEIKARGEEKITDDEPSPENKILNPIFNATSVTGDFLKDGLICFNYQISIDNNACLHDHRVFDKYIFPTDGYIELLYSVLREYFNIEKMGLKNIKISRPLVGIAGLSHFVKLELKEFTDGQVRFVISSQLENQETETIHIKGFVELDEMEYASEQYLIAVDEEPEQIYYTDDFKHLLPQIEGLGIYKNIIKKFVLTQKQSFALIDLEEKSGQSYIAQLLSTGLACAMSYGPYKLNQTILRQPNLAYLPYEINKISVYRHVSAKLHNCVVCINKITQESLELSFEITDEYDQVVLCVEGLHLYPVTEQQLFQSITRSQSASENAPDPLLIKKKEPTLISTTSQTDIAVVGISGRFSGAADVKGYWENLMHGVDSIKEIDIDRWCDYSWYDSKVGSEGHSYSKWGGFILNSDKFDPLFFNISPLEAELMDPQQRLFLEESWKAFEDAGYSPNKLEPLKVGVFVGVGSGDYLNLLHPNGLSKSGLVFTGSSQAILAARISYFMNLKGPALAIDTACSSSLVAIDRACQSILSGDCEMALAGGISLMATPITHIWTSQVGMPSKNGKCKTFDDAADGIVSGEGIGVVVLKRLTDAKRDGDNIYAVIKGSGINQDGKTNGITAPNIRSQEELQRDVYKKYKIDPATISYVEAHGTGTKLGDPIEVEALTRAFGAFTGKKGYCAIGSVKTNIGHTGFSAGVAGVIKCILMLQHRQLVPSLHYSNKNEHINFADSPFYVSTKLSEWKTEPGIPRRAAVNSFGFSGTNAHLVIEEYIAPDEASYHNSGASIVVLSAKNETRLREMVVNLRGHLKSSPGISLHDVAYTLQVGREAMEERLAVVARGIEELDQRLDNYLSGIASALFFRGNTRKDKLDFLLEGGAGEAYINYAFTHQETHSLAQLWVKGVAVDWELLYPDVKPRKISLPTYPFARDRYWVSLRTESAVPVIAEAKKLHPLLHSNESDFTEHKYSSLFTGEESFLSDHRVGEEKILPGAAYIELAREAGSRSARCPVTQLRDITWLSPVRVNGRPEKVQISLYSSGERIGYEVYTGMGKEEKLHSSGTLDTKIQDIPDRKDLSEIRNRLPHIIEGAACYNYFTEAGFNYGSSFRGIGRLYYGDNEALAQLNLTVPEGYVLAPGVVDSALQTCIGLSLGKASATVQLPYSVKTVNIHGPLSGNGWCYVTNSAGNTNDNSTALYDISVLNDSGEVLLEFKEFATVALPAGGQVKRQLMPAEPSPESTLFVPVWKRIRQVEPPAIAQTGGKQLLVKGTGTISLLNKLREQFAGLNCVVEEVEVLEGADLTGVTDIYLLHGLTEPAGINIGEVESAVFNTIKFLLSPVYVQQQLNITFFTLCTQKVLSGDRVRHTGGGIVGLAGSLAKEQPGWHIRVIDLEGETECRLEKFLQLPFSTDGAVTGYRNGYGYQKILYPFEATEQQGGMLRQGGNYVILGGSGGLGEVTTAYLIKQYGAQVIWLGRSVENDRIRALQDAMEELGVRPIYLQCDATDKAEVEQAYSRLKSMGMAVHGIFHSAIILNDMFIKNMTELDFKKSFDPKSSGSHFIIETFKSEPLDFICFYSSVQSHFNAAGQSNYAAGCTYKDSYAHSLSSVLSTPVRVINWGYWGEVGVVSSEAYRSRMAAIGIGSISALEGMHILELILSNEKPQVAAIKFI